MVRRHERPLRAPWEIPQAPANGHSRAPRTRSVRILLIFLIHLYKVWHCTSIPFLYEEAYQWYPSFDQLGDLIERPDPTSSLNLLKDVLNHLTGECGWPPHRIHFFGFAQGGSVAAEASLQWWRRELELSSQSRVTDKQTPVRPLGSLVTISGPLLSYPTLSKPCETPVFVFRRPRELKNGALDAFRKGFSRVKDVECVGEGMPRANLREEWQPIMQFWSEVLGRRPGDGLYEVKTGLES